VVTLTRAIIRVQSVKSKMIEPGYAWVRVSQFQEATAENMVKQLDALFRSGQVKGLVLDLRNDPGGLLHGAVAISSGFLPAKSLIVSTDGRAEDAKKKFFATPDDYVRGSRGEDVLKSVPSAAKTRADGGAGERRLRVGLRDRRRSPAGSQACHRDRHADLRQGLGADHHAAGQQHGDQAHHGALLHPGGRSIQALGITPDLMVEDPSDTATATRVREADLQRHLENGKAKMRRSRPRRARRPQFPAITSCRRAEAARLRRQG